MSMSISLIDAVKSGDRQEIIKLLDQGADPNYCENLVQLLISRGAEINAVTIFGEKKTQYVQLTPLHGASCFGRLEICTYLIEKGANLETRSVEERTPLHAGCYFGQAGSVKLLLQKGANVFTIDIFKRTPLHQAAMIGNTELLLILIRADIRVNARDVDGLTALHYAASNGHSTAVQTLLEHNAQVDIADEKGMTTLHYASIKGDTKSFQTLLSKGAFISFEDNEHNTPILLAIKHNQLDIINLLLDTKEVSIESKFVDNKTLLHFTAEFGSSSMLSELVHKHHANIHELDDFGRTPMHYATMSQRVQNMLFLYQQGTRMMKRDKVGQWAFSFDDPQLIFESLDPYPAMLELLSTAHGGFEELTLRHLPKLKSPMSFLTRFIRVDKETCTSDLQTLLLNRIKDVQNERTILRFFVKLLNFVKKSQCQHESESPFLKEIAEKIEAAIGALFDLDQLESLHSLHRLLIPSSEGSIFENQDFPRSFQFRSIINYCLENDLKYIFDKPQIASLTKELFTHTIHGDNVDNNNSENSNSIYAENEKHAVFLRVRNEFDVMCLRVRYCPAAAYFLEAIMKVFAFVVVIYTILRLKTAHPAQCQEQLQNYLHVEILYAMIITGQVLHEIGELAEQGYDFSKYFQDEWNVIDIVENGLGIAWLILRFFVLSTAGDASAASMNSLDNSTFGCSNTSSIIDSSFGLDHDSSYLASKVVLSMIPISLSLGLLRYFSIYKPLGELVIMIRVMANDLIIFLVVYLIPVIGFGTAFHGLFHEREVFQTKTATFLSMFSFTLGNFDFAVFDKHEESFVDLIGIMMVVFFLVTAVIVLLNLLVARMSNSFQQVSDQAFREWSFMKAQTVRSMMLWKERNCLSMLPAPLNLPTTFLAPFHYYWLRNLKMQSGELAHVSIAGTFTNILLAYIASIIRLPLVSWSLLRGRETIYIPECTRLVPVKHAIQPLWRAKDTFFANVYRVLLPLTYPIWELFYGLPVYQFSAFIDRVSAVDYTLLSMRKFDDRHVDFMTGLAEEQEDMEFKMKMEEEDLLYAQQLQEQEKQAQQQKVEQDASQEDDEIMKDVASTPTSPTERSHSQPDVAGPLISSSSFATPRLSRRFNLSRNGSSSRQFLSRSTSTNTNHDERYYYVRGQLPVKFKPYGVSVHRHHLYLTGRKRYWNCHGRSLPGLCRQEPVFVGYIRHGNQFGCNLCDFYICQLCLNEHLLPEPEKILSESDLDQVLEAFASSGSAHQKQRDEEQKRQLQEDVHRLEREVLRLAEHLNIQHSEKKE